MQILQNTEDYWAQVKELASALPPVVHLISIERTNDKSHVAGRIVEQLPFYAAQNIIDGTHRVCKQEEIKQWEADVAKAREQAKLDAIENKGIHIHPEIVVTQPKAK